MSYHRETANQTLKNQTTGNAEIRCRLEKTGKTGRPWQAGGENPVTLIFSRRYPYADFLQFINNMEV
jgi:hypothetical protein